MLPTLPSPTKANNHVIKGKYCGGNKLASIIVGHSGKSDLLFSGFGLAGHKH
jgi:hypothetical protein